MSTRQASGGQVWSHEAGHWRRVRPGLETPRKGCWPPGGCREPGLQAQVKEGPSTTGDGAGLRWQVKRMLLTSAVSLQPLGCSESMKIAVDRKVCQAGAPREDARQTKRHARYCPGVGPLPALRPSVICSPPSPMQHATEGRARPRETGLPVPGWKLLPSLEPVCPSQTGQERMFPDVQNERDNWTLSDGSAAGSGQWTVSSWERGEEERPGVWCGDLSDACAILAGFKAADNNSSTQC